MRDSIHKRINRYRVMWLFVFFDLPTNNKPERRAAAGFRKELMRDGFSMMQYSVYTRHCASWQHGQVHMRRVKKLIPQEGHVSILQVTDKQFGLIVNMLGRSRKNMEGNPGQLSIF